MKRIIFLSLIIGVTFLGLVTISKVVKATSGKLEEFNSIVIAPGTDPAFINELDNMFKEEYGKTGYEYYDATSEYGTPEPVKEFRIPFEGTVKNKKIDQKLQPILSGDSQTKKEQPDSNLVTVCGRFYDWYFWLGGSITFCGPMGSYLPTNMGWFDNRANSFYEYNTSWGAVAYDLTNGRNYLTDVSVDYYTLGYATNRISSLEIWF